MSEDDDEEDYVYEALRQWQCPKCRNTNLVQSDGKSKCSNCGYEP